jgi:hypothetical protein
MLYTGCSDAFYAVSVAGAFCTLEAIFCSFDRTLSHHLHENVCPWLQLNNCFILKLSFTYGKCVGGNATAFRMVDE